MFMEICEICFNLPRMFYPKIFKNCLIIILKTMSITKENQEILEFDLVFNLSF